MNVSTWLRQTRQRLFGSSRAQRRTPPSRRTVRLRLESLEDRLTPSTLTVGNESQLASAIQQANTNSAINAIVLQAGGTYDPTSALTLTATQALTIEGNGSSASSTLIDPNSNPDRLFHLTRVFVISGANVTFHNLTVAGGHASDAVFDNKSALGGGMVALNANITLDNVVLEDNQAVAKADANGNGEDAAGGGIYAVGGSLTITDNSQIVGNTAVGSGGTNQGGSGGNARGGGVFASKVSSVTISGNSIIRGNTAEGGNGHDGNGQAPSSSGFNGANGGQAQGGGLYVRGTGSVQITSSQLSDNAALGGGGGKGGDSPINDLDRISSDGGQGGNGGSAEGGGAYLLATGGGLTVEVSLSSIGTSGHGNIVRSGDGGAGGAGGFGNYGKANLPGTGGAGGVAGVAQGGGLYAEAAGALSLAITDTTLASNSVTGGEGGAGGAGGSDNRFFGNLSTGKGGNGGGGGHGGEAWGGAIYAVDYSNNVSSTNFPLTLSLSGCQIVNNTLQGGSSSGGGHGGNGYVDSGNGGYGGLGGLAYGAGVNFSSSNSSSQLSISASEITGNQGQGGKGGDGGDGANTYIVGEGSGGTGGLGGFGDTATGGGVAGFAVNGSATIIDSTVAGNTVQAGNGGTGGYGGLGFSAGNGGDGGPAAQATGAGINFGGTLTIVNSTIVGNKAVGGAGGTGGKGADESGTDVGTPGHGGNGGSSSGQAAGGGIDASTVTLINDTIADNAVYKGSGGQGGAGGFAYPSNGAPGARGSDATPSEGGGIIAGSGSNVTLTNTLVVRNIADTGSDVYGAVHDGGHNLIGNPSGSSGFSAANGDLLSVADPGVDVSLGDNGGSTLTLALLPGSPAIDAGASGSSVPNTDQRGYARINGKATDIGAVEHAPSQLFADLSPYGVWRYDTVTGSWQQLTPFNASALASGQSGAVASFQNAGVFLWTVHSGWEEIFPYHASQLAINSYNQIVGEFPGGGVWMYDPASGWRQLMPYDASLVAIDDLGHVAVNFPSTGVWLYTPSGASGQWEKIMPYNATQLAMANGEIAAAFGSGGLWEYDGSEWQKLAALITTSLSIDNDGNVLAAFGGLGEYLFQSVNSQWKQIDTDPAIAVGMDSTGRFFLEKADGLWEHQNGKWFNIDGYRPSLFSVSTGAV